MGSKTVQEIPTGSNQVHTSCAWKDVDIYSLFPWVHLFQAAKEDIIVLLKYNNI